MRIQIILATVICIASSACANRVVKPSTPEAAQAASSVRRPAETGTLLSKSPFFEYDVRFTNPECKEYPYEQPIKTNSGKMTSARPKNVFCSHLDSKISGARPEAPQAKLLEWINDPETTEIFFTYLSYSNSTVTNALCKAATDRNVEITFIIDQTSDATKAEELAACGGATNHPTYFKRGHTGGIGYAHNKIFIANPQSKDKIRISFGSGNMTSGIVLHHENWHFITTHASTYFAQSHLCVMKNTLDEKTDASVDSYISAMKSCRAAITAPEEDDVKAMFIPGDGDRATDFMINGTKGFPGIRQAKEIRIAAHRFSYWRMKKALKDRQFTGPVKMQIVTDDDMYWVGTTGQAFGDNGADEYQAIQDLSAKGAEAKYMETNDSEHLLHHNKYLVFDDKAVFAGAGNLTGAGFTQNHENFYYIMIPDVVAKFRKQYEHVWNDLATSPENLPAEHTIPPIIETP